MENYCPGRTEIENAGRHRSWAFTKWDLRVFELTDSVCSRENLRGEGVEKSHSITVQRKWQQQR